MKKKILYFSKSGNTQKLAEAISEAIDTEAEIVPPAYPPEGEKLIFLGASEYKGKPHKELMKFVDTLNTDRARYIALFGTYGKSIDSTFSALKSTLESKGIEVLDSTYSCLGKGFLFKNKNCPTQEDLENIKKWSKDILEKLTD